MKTVLISGGNGMVGKNLGLALINKGYNVRILSRSPLSETTPKQFYWNIERMEVDEAAFINCDYIIHLAGENISAKRWSDSQKTKIINSRVNSSKLLLEAFQKTIKKPIAVISASAIGYYGTSISEKIFKETDPPSNNFLGKTCVLWENEINKSMGLGIRTVIVRTGIVLSTRAGLISKLLKPIKYNLLSSFGNGKQYMPWIHIDDLCEIYIHAIENDLMSGAFNAVAPEHTTNKAFINTIGAIAKKSFFIPSIPAILLKLIFGEMSQILIYGNKISSDKITSHGFVFKFPKLNEALQDILKKP